MKIDWKRLSTVEMASGIEVIYLAKMFRFNKFLHKKIIKHALDEYRHSSIFYKFHKKYGDNNQTISTPQALIGLAGLGKSPMDREEKNILRACTYVFIGEYRAIEFNNQATSLIKNKEILKSIKEIELDEQQHALGVKKYLDKNPMHKYISYLIRFKIKYLFQKYFTFKLVTKLQGNAGNFLSKFIFKILPNSIFQIKTNESTLKEALSNAKTM